MLPRRRLSLKTLLISCQTRWLSPESRIGSSIPNPPEVLWQIQMVAVRQLASLARSGGFLSQGSGARSLASQIFPIASELLNVGMLALQISCVML